MIPDTIRRAIPIRQPNGANGMDMAELSWRGFAVRYCQPDRDSRNIRLLNTGSHSWQL